MDLWMNFYRTEDLAHARFKRCVFKIQKKKKERMPAQLIRTAHNLAKLSFYQNTPSLEAS